MLTLQELEYNDDDVHNLTLSMHIIGGISAVSTSLAVYMIVFQSPKSMGIYKWFLLNIVVSIFWFEMFITIFFIPFPIFPIPGFCSIGPLKGLDWYWGSTVPFFVMTLFLGICGMSVNSAAAFRLSAIYGESQKFTKPFYLTLLMLSQIFYALPTVIAGLLAVQDREKSVQEMVAGYPKMKEFFISHTCFVIPLDDNPTLYVCISIALFQLVLVEIISSNIFLLSYRSLAKRKKVMSKKVYVMHKQLLYSLLAQFAVPIITINTPFLLYCTFLITQSLAGVTFAPFMFIGITTHSFFNTLIMITMTAPYRRTILRWLRLKKNSKSIDTMANTVTMTMHQLERRTIKIT